MPVFPDVASTTVCPGFSNPSRSANVSADDPDAEEDISRWVTRNGHELLNLDKDGSVTTLKIKKLK